MLLLHIDMISYRKHVLIISLFVLLCNSYQIPYIRNKLFCTKLHSRDSKILDRSYHSSFNCGVGVENVLFADDDIVVVNKPANLQTAPGHIHKESLAGRISHKFNVERVDRMVVHRLDYATSGVVVFARNILALKAINQQFRRKVDISKSYVAIVMGQMLGMGNVNLPISPDTTRGPPYFKIGQGEDPGKEAMTDWSAVQTGNTCTLVRLKPLTGRYSI